METIDIIRLILIIAVIVYFIAAMMSKKISTIIALPAMGILVALIATVGSAPGVYLGFFDHVDPADEIDPLTGEVLIRQGIMNGVVGEGAKMMSSAMISAIFGGALAVLLKKLGVIEGIVKSIAELAGEKPFAMGFAFYIATVLIFAAIGGLGPVILIGSIALPIMMSAGIKPIDAASIVLLGLSTGGIINPANWATYTTILTETGIDEQVAYENIVNMSFMIFIVIFLISIIYIYFIIRKTTFSRAWTIPEEDKKPKVTFSLAIAPIVPIIIIFITFFLSKIYPQVQIMSPEFAILLGIIYTVFAAKRKNKLQLITSSFIEGTQEVAGALVLLVGLGILIKGFQYYTVTPLITPAIEGLVSALQNPITYIIGFTIATPLVLYRGPLNTFGIGGSIPAIFAQAGFSPLATIYALRAVGNLQGFGDPTNSHNIWIADFVKVDPNDITKKLIGFGFIMSFIVLLLAVILNPTMLG